MRPRIVLLGLAGCATPSPSTPTPSLVPSQPLVDPKTIVGHVRCRTPSDEAEGKLDAQVTRKLPPGKRPMPDYVGGWLDSAIVRAR